MQDFFHQQWHWDNQSQKILSFWIWLPTKKTAISNHWCHVPGKLNCTQTNKQTPGVILILPTQTSCTIIFGKSLKTTIYMCIQFDNSPKNGSHVFFPLRPPRPKAHLRKQGQRDYDLRPCSRVLGMWWRCQRLTGNKKNLGKNRIFFSWDLNGSARETVLKCQFFTSFQLRDCQTKSRQYRRVWINQEGFELRLPWGDPRYLQLRSS